MPNILKEFQKQLEKDRQEENYDLEDSPDNVMSDEEYEEYKKEIDSLREEMYINIPKTMSSKIENKSYPNSLVKNEVKRDYMPYQENEIKLNLTDIRPKNVTETTKDENGLFESKGNYTIETLETNVEELGCINPFKNTKRFALIHAKCPFCGEEIESLIPTMYNPFNFSLQTPYKCQKCGSQYITDYGYPHLALIDENNNIINTHLH